MGEKVDTNVWHNNIILEEIESQVGRAPVSPPVHRLWRGGARWGEQGRGGLSRGGWAGAFLGRAPLLTRV